MPKPASGAFPALRLGIAVVNPPPSASLEAAARLTRRFQRAADLAAALTLTLGAWGLGAWIIGHPILTAFRPDYWPMSPKSAVAFVAMGVGLLLAGRARGGTAAGRLAMLSAVLVLTLCAWSLVETVTGVQPGLEHALFAVPPDLDARWVFLISPAAIVCFVLAAAGLLTRCLVPGDGTGPVMPLCGTLIAAVNFVVLLGYVYGTPLLYGGIIRPVGISSALALCALGVALLVLGGPEGVPLRWLVGPSIRARLLRAFLPTVFLLVVLEELVGDLLHAAATDNPALRDALKTLVSAIVVTGVIAWLARKLGRELDTAREQRGQAEAALQAAHDELESRVKERTGALEATNRQLQQQSAELVQAEAVARRNEARFAALAETNPAVVFVQQQQVVLYANAQAEATLHLPRAALIGRNILEFVRPDYQALVQERATRREAGETVPQRYEVPILRDGETRWLDCSSVRIEFDGQPALLTIALDITERRSVEADLRATEQRFRQVVEHIREVFWMTDPSKNRTLYVSPAYEEIWGRPCASLYQSPREWLAAIHPDDRDRVLAAALNRQVSGQYHEVYRITRPDGTVRWIDDRAFPVRDESGKVYRIVGIAEDITERRRAEEQAAAFSRLGAQLSGARTALEAALILVSLADDLFGWDACYLHLHGLDTQQLEPILTMDTSSDGRRFQIPPESFTPDLSPLMRDVLEHGSRLINRDQPAFAPAGSLPLTPFGDESRPSASMMYVLIRRGKRNAGILSIQSYTPRAYREEDLALLQALADHGAAALERIQLETAMHHHEQTTRRLAAEVLEISDRERRTVGYDLHDGLGQFLSGIALKGKVLEQSLASESLPHASAAAHLVRLINQANDHARSLARGLDPIEAEAGGLAPALRHLAVDAEKLFSITCRVQVPDTVLLAPTASLHLYRIAQEAISNALKHGQARRIDITVAASPTETCLTIRDDGLGFNPEHTARGGMGLQIMRYRAESLGGSLTLCSRPGDGAEVRCVVPSKPQEPAA